MYLCVITYFHMLKLHHLTIYDYDVKFVCLIHCLCHHINCYLFYYVYNKMRVIEL